MQEKLFGGIEFGGTKTICAIGDASGSITSQTLIPTTSVSETLAAVAEFFKGRPVSLVGVGSFGPLNLNDASSEYGYICNTPKQGWSNVNLKGLLESRLELPVRIDTDVNTAALGELYYGLAKAADNFIYLTIGTGIGGALIINKKLIRGILNLEMGHMRIPHEPFDDTFQGACSFHADCLEGIASGYAMEQRYGKKTAQITDQEAWNREAGYIAVALVNLMFTHGPELIILGGGVTDHPGLIPKIREIVPRYINGYLNFPDLDTYIVGSSGDTNGVLGAIKLASDAH
ncbi:ROK family protein [soil metagenome]